MAFLGEEDDHSSSDDSDIYYGEEDDHNSSDDSELYWGGLNHTSEEDDHNSIDDSELYCGDMNHTIDLSDFHPDYVTHCYMEVSELKRMGLLDTLDNNHACKLELAVKDGNLPMVLVLLENGCTHMKWGWLNILENTRLVNFYENHRYSDHDWTPLTAAVNDQTLSEDSRLEIVNFLLKFDQNLNIGDEYYRTAAHWATFRGLPHILQALLFKGANVQEVDRQVESLMGYAINKWTNTPAISINLVNVLLRNNFRVNTRNANMNTPLHLAVLASSEEIVLILLQNDANKWLKNEDGDTPMDIARTQGAQNMILLLKHAPMHRSGG